MANLKSVLVAIVLMCGCTASTTNGVPAYGSDAYWAMKAAQWGYHAGKVNTRTASASTRTLLASEQTVKVTPEGAKQ